MSSTPEGEHLTLLLRVNTILNSTQSLDQVLDRLIEQVIETFQAERGFVVLCQGEEFRSVAARYSDSEHKLEASRFSRSVVKSVVHSGKALRALDAADDYRASPSIQMMGIRSILCAPLRWEGEVRGVVYTDHRVKPGVFTEAQVPLLEAIADQASRTLENAALHQRLQRAHQAHLEQARLRGDASEPAAWERQAAPKTVDFLLTTLKRETPAATPAHRPEPEDVGERPRLYLFGPLTVRLKERAIENWPARKNRDLFAYLAAHRGQVIHEDKLIELFWSRGGKKGRHSLHNAITQIRKLLGDSHRELVQRRLDGYSLSNACWLDIEEFSLAYKRGREAARQELWEQALAELRKADALSELPFLEGLQADWVDLPRFRLAEQVTDCRALLADYFSLRGRHLVAVELWQRVLSLDNCSETAYRGLLRAYRALGRPAEAARTYEACTTAFREELDLEPPADLKALIDF